MTINIPSEPKPLRLGFVGLRNIGLNHLRKALDLPGVTVTALADTEAQRRQKAAALVDEAAAREASSQTPGIVTCYAAADALFEAADVDAVVLAVPNPLHAPMATAAMRQGKDVLVEKPIARDAAEARQMIGVRNQTGRCLMVGMNQRFNPLTVAARNAIAAGAIGRVQQCRTRWLRERTPLWGARGDWWLTPEHSGGGPLMDLGIHKLDQVLYLLGGHPRIGQVHGFTTRGVGSRELAARGAAYEVEDYACGCVHLADGPAITVEASYFLNLPGEIQDTVIVGTEGTVTIAKGEATLLLRTGDTLTSSSLEPDTRTATSCVEHFCRVLRGEEDLIPTAEEGLLGLEIIEAIYAADHRGSATTP